ncbi:hypothetical protein IYW40_04715 [Methylocystis sp. H4A]|uniref:hypothetical protein n=1 Tax=Methylocystis sp. H4A TaxID=2785788 RepID=UPI0018C1E426|nr:hypothetical protein [Methylocystis sp. H4A]MBG0800795.1 hypothetical protein [Methylocystis sp. H4A]
MPDTVPEGWRDAGGREAEKHFAVMLDSIGKHLRVELAKAVSEPLPKEMTALLIELQRRRAQNRNKS